MIRNLFQRWCDIVFFGIGNYEIVYLLLFFAYHSIDFQNTFNYTYIILEGTFKNKYTYPHPSHGSKNKTS